MNFIIIFLLAVGVFFALKKSKKNGCKACPLQSNCQRKKKN